MKIEIEEQPDFAFRPYPRLAVLIPLFFLVAFLIGAVIKGNLIAVLIIQVLIIGLLWIASDSYRITTEFIVVKRLWTKTRVIPRSSIVKIT